MNRRGFMGLIGGAVAAAGAVELWEPGKKLISIPRTVKPIRMENWLHWCSYQQVADPLLRGPEQFDMQWIGQQLRSEIEAPGGELRGFKRLGDCTDYGAPTRFVEVGGMPIRIITMFDHRHGEVLTRFEVLAIGRRLAG